MCELYLRSNLKPYPMSLGYRMPAEWERHASTWLTWPHNVETWPDMLSSVEKENDINCHGFIGD